MADDLCIRACTAFMGAWGVASMAAPAKFEDRAWEPKAGRNPGATAHMGMYITTTAASIALLGSGPNASKEAKKDALKLLGGIGAVGIARVGYLAARGDARKDMAIAGSVATLGMSAWALARGFKKNKN